MKILVLFNPKAGRNRKHPEWPEQISSLLGSSGEIAVTDGVNELSELISNHFGDSSRKRPDVLCFCGGDGTCHYMLTGLLAKLSPEEIPPICLLPGGSMNTVGGTLGIKGDPLDQLSKVCRLLSEGGFPRIEARRPLLINDKACFLFGAGTAMVMIEEYYSMQGDPGPRKAGELAYRAIASIIIRNKFYKQLKEPVRCSVVVDGKKLPHERYRLLLGGTVEEIGLGFRLLYRAPEDRTKFHFIASLFKPMKFLRQLRKMYVGQPLAGRNHHDVLCEKVVIEPDEKMKYLVNGELFETEEPLNVSLGPPIKLLVP